MAPLGGYVDWCRASLVCNERRTGTDEESNHTIVSIVRCTIARRRPWGILSVDVGAQLEEELGGVDVAFPRCVIERAFAVASRLVHVCSQFCE